MGHPTCNGGGWARAPCASSWLRHCPYQYPTPTHSPTPLPLPLPSQPHPNISYLTILFIPLKHLSLKQMTGRHMYVGTARRLAFWSGGAVGHWGSAGRPGAGRCLPAVGGVWGFIVWSTVPGFNLGKPTLVSLVLIHLFSANLGGSARILHLFRQI